MSASSLSLSRSRHQAQVFVSRWSNTARSQTAVLSASGHARSRPYATTTTTSSSSASGSGSSTDYSDNTVLIYQNGPPASGSAAKGANAEMIKFAGKKAPITPGIRHSIQIRHPHLYDGDPVRELTIAQRKKGGRNNTGRVVNRHRGGGHKRRLRLVDFFRREEGEHEVLRIEYDPGRSAHIALIRKKQSTSGQATGGSEAAAQSVRNTIVETPSLSWLPQTYRLPKTNTGSSLGSGTTTAPLTTTAHSGSESPVVGYISYILAPDGLRAGDVVRSYRSGIPSDLIAGLDLSDSSSSDTSSSRSLGLLRTLTLKPGNVLPLHLCPPGTIIHNISLSPSGKMQLCRSAGTFGQVVAHGIGKKEDGSESTADAASDESSEIGKKFKGWTLVKLSSGEVRKLHPECVATIGVVSNKEHQQKQIGKAGRARWLGRKPRVRGVAMNAADHPHGGGRGKSKGNKDPRSVYGWLTRGKRTRRPKDRDGNKMVVTERPRGRATKA